MRPLVALLLVTACAGADRAPDAPPSQETAAARQPAGLDDARTEVAAIRQAARDATAALAGDAARWDQARQAVVTPLDRDLVERRLAAHAERHGLELSQFRLAAVKVAPLDLPARIHPASPYPLQPEEAILEIPIRFALTPLAPARIESFLRTLPEVRPLVIVRAVERGMDFVEVEAAVPTFRPLDPAPRYALEVPPPEYLDGGGSAGAYRALVEEVEETNEALAALSEARLRRVRLQAHAAAEEKAARNAASIELPPPARPGAPAPRTTAP